MKTFRLHQAEAFARYQHEEAMPLFFDMRLGKSIVALRWARWDARGPTLIVCPLTPMGGWVRELEDEGITYYIYHRGEEDLFADVCLCTYQTLALNPTWAQKEWDSVILDESTEIKNPRSKVAKLAVRYLSRARKRAVLAGVPDPESRFDLFTQMAFVHGGSWMGSKNFWEWRQRHARNFGFEWVMSATTQEKIIAEAHRTATFLSRKEAGLGSEKIYERRERPLDPEAAAFLKKVGKTWRTGPQEAKHRVAVSTWLHRICGGFTPEEVELPCWKYEELLSLVTGELGREQVVVWFNYSLEMRRAWRILKEAGVSVTYVQGDTSMAQRMARRDAFHRRERRVMLIQASCGKFGYDLSAADTAIYFSSTWSSLARRQSEDRIESAMHKSGNLLLIDLVSIGTPDEEVLRSLADKEISSEETARRILAVYT